MSIARDMRRMQERIEELEEGEDNSGRKKKDKKFKMPRRWNGIMKKSQKKSGRDKILILYLRKNGRIEGPVMKTYSDNVITLNYKAYDVDPRAIWSWGKYKVYVFKEIDRRPVSNLNYKEIMRRGDLTDSDEILLKATMKAISGGAKKAFNMKALLIIGAIVVAAAMMFLRGG